MSWRQRRRVAPAPVVFEVDKPLPQTEEDLKEFNAIYRKATAPRVVADKKVEKCVVPTVNAFDALRWTSTVALVNAVVGLVLSGIMRPQCPCVRSTAVFCCGWLALLTEMPMWFSWCAHPRRRDCLHIHSFLSSDVFRGVLYVTITAVLATVEVVAASTGNVDQRGTFASFVLIVTTTTSAAAHFYQMGSVLIMAEQDAVANSASLELAQLAARQERLVGLRVNRLVSEKFVNKWRAQVGRYMFTERQVRRLLVVCVCWLGRAETIWSFSFQSLCAWRRRRPRKSDHGNGNGSNQRRGE